MHLATFLIPAVSLLVTLVVAAPSPEGSTAALDYPELYRRYIALYKRQCSPGCPEPSPVPEYCYWDPVKCVLNCV